MLIEQHLSYKIYSDLPQHSLLIDFPENLQRPNPNWLKHYPENDVYDASVWKPTHNVVLIPNWKPKFDYPQSGEKETQEVRHEWNNHVLTETSDPDWPSKKIFINHSFEPIRFYYDEYFWNEQHFNNTYGYNNFNIRPQDSVYILHSEKNSEDIKLIQQNIDLDIKFVHWFSHGYLCSKHWYSLQSPRCLDILKPIHKHFVCMNRIIGDNKDWRLKLLNKLDLAQGVYSLPDVCPHTGKTPDQILESNTVKPNSFDWHGNDSGYVDVAEYTPINTSFLHIVNETLFYERKQHLTEKTFKPIVLMQPFVLAAPPGCLAYLKSYGFKTFDTWWDESYDTIQDNEQRLTAIADIVNDICKLSIQQLQDLQKEMSAVLLHNRRFFYEHFGDVCYQELLDGITNLD